jgi:hypothetical protein
MFARRETVSLTTAADGSATGYTPVVNGRVLSLIYTKTDFANGVDFVASLEATGEVIWTGTDVNASAVIYPRVPVHDEAGVVATSDGTRKLRDSVVAVNDRVKIVVASGGDTKTGTVTVVVG